MSPTFGVLALLEAKPGKGEDLGKFLGGWARSRCCGAGHGDLVRVQDQRHHSTGFSTPSTTTRAGKRISMVRFLRRWARWPTSCSLSAPDIRTVDVVGGEVTGHGAPTPPYRALVRRGKTMQVPAPFEYERASSVDDAIALLERHGEDARLIAGGHSLLPLMKLRFAAPEVLVDINDLTELQRICGSR